MASHSCLHSSLHSPHVHRSDDVTCNSALLLPTSGRQTVDIEPNSTESLDRQHFEATQIYFPTITLLPPPYFRSVDGFTLRTTVRVARFMSEILVKVDFNIPSTTGGSN